METTTQSGTSSAAPARVGPLEAVFRKPLWAVAPIVLLAVPLVGRAVTADPTYTCEARMLVGRVDVEAAAVPGFVDASVRLASTYARYANSQGNLELISQKLPGTTPASLKGRVSASPIPNDVIIRVQATGPDEAGACELADVAMTSLREYITTRNDPTTRAGELLDQIETVSVEFNTAQARLTAANRALDRAQSAATPNQNSIDQAQDAVIQAQSAVDIARLRRDTLNSLYTDALRGQVDASLFQTLSDGQSQGSDRRAKLQLAVAISVLFGGLIGVLLAWLSANRWQFLPARSRSDDQTADRVADLASVGPPSPSTVISGPKPADAKPADAKPADEKASPATASTGGKPDGGPPGVKPGTPSSGGKPGDKPSDRLGGVQPGRIAATLGKGQPNLPKPSTPPRPSR